jgi:hypothetical protein
MLVFMQAAGKITISISGATFAGCSFAVANMGKCTIHALSPTQIEISGASQQFLWVVDVKIDPLSAGEMTASTDASSELHFSDLPFGGEKHVPPGSSNVVIFEWISFFKKRLV